LLQIPNIRRGFPPGVAAAEFLATVPNTGDIASSIGNESKIPAPRKNLRREIAPWVEMYGLFIA
jgi:hypothetical protein